MLLSLLLIFYYYNILQLISVQILLFLCLYEIQTRVRFIAIIREEEDFCLRVNF